MSVDPSASASVTTLPDLTDHLARHPGELVHAVLHHGDGRLSASPALVPAHLDLLVGFRAPRHWHGVAVVAPGATVRVLDGAGADPLDAPTPLPDDPVVVAVAVDRSGAVAATSVGPHHRWTGHGDTEVGGFVVDLCRRMLDLPCPPEPRPPAELAVVQWLSLLLDLAADPLTAPTVGAWPDVAALHPAWDGVEEAPEALGRLTRAVAREWSWEALRVGAATGELHIEGVTPSVARWMDAPFLARFLLGGHREPSELLDDLRLFLHPDVHDAVVRAVGTAAEAR